jgi:VWFA-related protein
MHRGKIAALALAAAFIFITASLSEAQRATPAPAGQTTSVEREEQEQVKVYTEEVVLPVVAYDDGGRFDPTLEPDDVLVLEDNVPQQVRSVRRLPAHILLVLDIGSQVTALTKSSNITREVALKLADIFAGDEIAIVQNSNRVELLLDWTTDADFVAHVLKTKFFTGNRSRLSECLMMAAEELKYKPAGNTHVIILTDGLESGNNDYELAVRQLAATQAAVHTIAYSALSGQVIKGRNSLRRQLPVIDLDFEMKRWFKNYAEEMKRNDQRLLTLTQETGGRLFLPDSTLEAASEADQIGHDIRAQYVVTYQPKRPFASANAKERRHIRVLPRRAGLQLQSLRSSIANTAAAR